MWSTRSVYSIAISGWSGPIPVEGPVAWVVTSPSTDHTAVGVLKRRYSLDTVREMEKCR